MLLPASWRPELAVRLGQRQIRSETGGRFADRLRRGRLAGIPRESGADQAFEPAFGGVCCHITGLQFSDRDFPDFPRFHSSVPGEGAYIHS